MVHSGVFSYIFAIKCRESYVIIVFLAIDSDTDIRRNSSGNEIANVNFLYDDIVKALQNTIDSCINSATDGRGYVSEHSLPNSVK